MILRRHVWEWFARGADVTAIEDHEEGFEDRTIGEGEPFDQ